MRVIIFLISLFLSFSAFSIVDTRSAGYSKTFIDFKSGDSNVPLVIERTYNSRSLHNGLFGFGWCSNLETLLAVLPDNSLRVVECGGGMEVLYHLQGSVPNVNLYVSAILKQLKSRKVKMSKKALNKLRKDLLQSHTLRADFIKALQIKGQAQSGLKYYAKGRSNEYVLVHSRGYTRYLPNGVRENFDKQGRLLKSSDKQGYIEFSWKSKQVQIMDKRGNRLVLFFNKQGKVNQARYNKLLVAKYSYKGENLVKITNNWKENFQHRYDRLHNLIKNIYPDKTTEELSYNVKKDWVMSFKDRRECKESYDYGVNKKNSNHYFSIVEKKCGRTIVNKSRYEFWHKNRPGGGKYLYRARARVNGRLKTDVIYHPVFGTPVSFFKNGVRTRRSYYANGFLKEKDNIYQNVKYFKYNVKCRKPELVQVNHKKSFGPDRGKIIRTEKIRFKFNKCLLAQAKKSNDEWIRVRHDSKGRIVYMEDQSRKIVTLSWHKTFNKPEMITRKDVGSIRIVYDKAGAIKEIKNFQKDPTVITQVASVFNSFLSTLSSVAEEMVIL